MHLGLQMLWIFCVFVKIKGDFNTNQRDDYCWGAVCIEPKLKYILNILKAEPFILFNVAVSTHPCNEAARTLSVKA